MNQAQKITPMINAKRAPESKTPNNPTIVPSTFDILVSWKSSIEALFPRKLE
jgi:hypothetical protein